MLPFDTPQNIRKSKVFWCFQGDKRENWKEKIKHKKVKKNQIDRYEYFG